MTEPIWTYDADDPHEDGAQSIYKNGVEITIKDAVEELNRLERQIAGYLLTELRRRDG